MIAASAFTVNHSHAKRGVSQFSLVRALIRESAILSAVSIAKSFQCTEMLAP